MERTGISLNFEHLWNSSSLLFRLDLVSTRSMFLELGCGLSDNKQLFLLTEVTIYFDSGQFKWQRWQYILILDNSIDRGDTIFGFLTIQTFVDFPILILKSQKIFNPYKDGNMSVAYICDLVIVDCYVKKVRSLVYIRILFKSERGDQPHRAPSSCCASASVALAAHWELVLIL